jgi:uncharacterized damage-inducible protein DinB
MEFREVFLKQKEALRKRTRETLALIRPEHLDYRPEKEALTIHEMVRHLWRSEEGVRRVALENDFTYYRTRIPQGLRATLDRFQSLDEELANIERVHQETLAAVAKAPAEVFDVERVNDELNYRRKVWVILMAINEHEIHHRAQLMTYLRMLGTPIADAARQSTPLK